MARTVAGGVVLVILREPEFRTKVLSFAGYDGVTNDDDKVKLDYDKFVKTVHDHLTSAPLVRIRALLKVDQELRDLNVERKGTSRPWGLSSPIDRPPCRHLGSSGAQQRAPAPLRTG